MRQRLISLCTRTLEGELLEDPRQMARVNCKISIFPLVFFIFLYMSDIMTDRYLGVMNQNVFQRILARAQNIGVSIGEGWRCFSCLHGAMRLAIIGIDAISISYVQRWITHGHAETEAACMSSFAISSGRCGSSDCGALEPSRPRSTE